MAKALLFVIWMVSSFAYAQSFGLDLILVEEGDDRIRPGLSMLGRYDDYKGELTMYGRKYGPITERTFILSASKYLDVFRFGEWNQIKGSFGFAAMNEMISMDSPSEKKTEYSGNVGAVVGVHQHFKIHDQMSLHWNWQSFVFPAGLAGIFLSTGRKQTIGVGFDILL